MRAIPTPHSTTARTLPHAQVQQIVHTQVVDLNPEGNTVAIKTISDNPLEDSKPIRVVTQASGGISEAPTAHQSRGIMHSFMPGIGDDSYTATVAKSSHGSMLAGLGATEEPKPGIFANVSNLIKDVGTTYAGIETSGDTARIEEARARAEGAKAEATKAVANAEIEKSRFAAALRSTNVSVGGFKFNWPLMVGGVGLLGVALFLKSKQKGKK